MGTFPMCSEISRFVPVCPLLSFLGPRTAEQIRTKEDKREKMGHFGTNWEVGSTPFSSSLEKAVIVYFNKKTPTPHRRWDKVRGSIAPTFTAGLPLPWVRNPKSQSMSLFRKNSPSSPENFPGVFLGTPRKHPTNSHSLLEFLMLESLKHAQNMKWVYLSFRRFFLSPTFCRIVCVNIGHFPFK